MKKNIKIIVCIFICFIFTCLFFPSIYNELFYRFGNYGWYSNSIDDYKNNTYVNYVPTNNINNFIPSFTELNSNTNVLDFEFSDKFYRLPQALSNRGNCWCTLTLSYKSKEYDEIKSHIVSNKVEYYERGDFDGYRLPSDENTWIEIDFSDNLKIIRYFYLYKIKPEKIHDLSYGSSNIMWEHKVQGN